MDRRRRMERIDCGPVLRIYARICLANNLDRSLNEGEDGCLPGTETFMISHGGPRMRPVIYYGEGATESANITSAAICPPGDAFGPDGNPSRSRRHFPLPSARTGQVRSCVRVSSARRYTRRLCRCRK